MRILYISHTNGTDQGALIALRNIVLSMREVGHHPMVVFPEEGGMKDVLQSNGITCHRIVYRTARYPRVKTPANLISELFHFLAIPYRNIMAEWHLMRLIRREHIDIVHINSSVVSVGRNAARIAGVPYVVHVREMISADALPWQMFPSNTYFRHRLQSCPNCIAITQAVRDFWELTEQTTRVVYDGVFTLNRKPDIKCNKQPYFLCIGVINSTKRQLDVLYAFAKIAQQYPQYQLWLVGECNPNNPYYQDFLHQVENLDLVKQVHTLGIRHDIYDLLQNATAMVAASNAEGFGFTVVEAMLCGCLVLGRNAAGIREQLDRGLHLTGSEIGLRFQTVNQLAQQMEQVCKNGIEPYREMIIRAQELAFREYSVAHNAHQIEEFYQEIVKNK